MIVCYEYRRINYSIISLYYIFIAIVLIISAIYQCYCQSKGRNKVRHQANERFELKEKLISLELEARWLKEYNSILVCKLGVKKNY